MHLRLIILAASFLAFFLAYPAPARVVYVSQSASGDGSGLSWDNACRTITAGLAASASGDEIWIKSATHYEAIDSKNRMSPHGNSLGAGKDNKQSGRRTNKTFIFAGEPCEHVLSSQKFQFLWAPPPSEYQLSPYFRDD